MNEEYEYCASENFHDNMKEIFSVAFEISDYSKIETAYKEFRNNFYGTDVNGIQNIRKILFKSITEEEKFHNSFLDINSRIGIDLPTLINKKNGGGKMIMIVGEDPLRNQSPDEIILSTPYGIHLKESTEGIRKIYWEISKHILFLGHSIYYTDVNKIWIKLGKHKIAIPRDLKERFKNCLIKEIEIFKPELVITFGKVATNTISEILVNYPKIPVKLIGFPHPSGSANGSWSKLITRNINQSYASDKYDYIIKRVEEQLSEVPIDNQIR